MMNNEKNLNVIDVSHLIPAPELKIEFIDRPTPKDIVRAEKEGISLCVLVKHPRCVINVDTRGAWINGFASGLNIPFSINILIFFVEDDSDEDVIKSKISHELNSLWEESKDNLWFPLAGMLRGQRSD